MLNDCGTVEVVEQPPHTVAVQETVCTVEVTEQLPHTVVVQEGCCPPQVIELGIAGPQGPVARDTFEAISKNLKSHPGVFAYNQAGKLASITYTNVVKTFAYNQAGKLASVTLSGAGVPDGIPVSKVFTYTAGGKLAGFTYE